MIELLEYILSDGWRFLGTVILLLSFRPVRVHKA